MTIRHWRTLSLLPAFLPKPTSLHLYISSSSKPNITLKKNIPTSSVPQAAKMSYLHNQPALPLGKNPLPGCLFFPFFLPRCAVSCRPKRQRPRYCFGGSSSTWAGQPERLLGEIGRMVWSKQEVIIFIERHSFQQDRKLEGLRSFSLSLSLHAWTVMKGSLPFTLVYIQFSSWRCNGTSQREGRATLWSPAGRERSNLTHSLNETLYALYNTPIPNRGVVAPATGLTSPRPGPRTSQPSLTG